MSELAARKYRIEATCSKELWEDKPAILDWARDAATRKCQQLGYQLAPQSEVLMVREAVEDADFRVVIIFTCLPSPPALSGTVSVRIIDQVSSAEDPASQEFNEWRKTLVDAKEISFDGILRPFDVPPK
jgi:hypothetical protein